MLAFGLFGCSFITQAVDDQPPTPQAAATAAPFTTGQTVPTAADAMPPGQERWQPPLHFSWQWQLSDEFDAGVAADVYDLDLFETDGSNVAALKAAGKQVICYLSAGSLEDWRPDTGLFAREVIGANYEGWPGERWLDIRRIDLLAAALTARLDLCRQKGFAAVEPDNIDGYANFTGFPLTAADQLIFNRWLAGEAHARGLAIGLKNDPDQAEALADDFDWALTEDCLAEGWCETMLPFVKRGKPVLMAEYTDTNVVLADVCVEAQRLGYNAIMKNRELDAARSGCE